MSAVVYGIAVIAVLGGLVSLVACLLDALRWNRERHASRLVANEAMAMVASRTGIDEGSLRELGERLRFELVVDPETFDNVRSKLTTGQIWKTVDPVTSLRQEFLHTPPLRASKEYWRETIASVADIPLDIYAGDEHVRATVLGTLLFLEGMQGAHGERIFG